MSIDTRLSAMQKLADTLNDAVSQLEGSSGLLGEWQEIADTHEPEDIKEKLRALEEWDRLEYVHGYDANDVETKLEELEAWDSIESEYGDASEVEERLEELTDWRGVESTHGDAAAINRRMEELYEWDTLEANYGMSLDNIKEHLDGWNKLREEHGSLKDIHTILREHGTATMQDMKELLQKKGEMIEKRDAILGDFIKERDRLAEEQEVLLTEANDSAKRAWEEGAHQWAELTALKNRSRWQVFLSLFTGWRS
jgi:DNA-binding transcriptional MerR regulator